MFEIILIIAVGLIKAEENPIISISFGNNERLSPFMCPFFIEEDCNDRYYTIQNTYNPYSVFINGYVKKDPSKIRDMHKDFTFEQKFKGDLYVTDFNVSGHVISNYSSYVLDDINYFSDNVGISLAYHFIDESYSIVHQLFKHKYINKMTFAFEDAGRDVGITHFGGIPSDKHLSFKYKGYFKIDESLPSWGFNLDAMVYDNVSYTINMPTVIHTGLRGSFFSNELFAFMKNYVLKDKFDKKICSVEKGKFGGRTIYCTTKEDETIDFIFGKNKITLNTRYVFSDSNFVDNPYDYYNFTGLFLGVFFLKKFQYSQFDYENKRVELYSNVIPINLVTFDPVKIIHIINLECGFGLLIFIILFLIKKLKLQFDIKLIAVGP